MPGSVVNPVMNSRTAILNELRSLDSHLPLTASPSFSVPEGYFENLAASVLARVKTGDALTSEAEINGLSPLLAGISKKMPYSVPSFYFTDNLPTTPVSQTEAATPVLSAIGKEMPYAVPETYFDDLPALLLSRVSEPKTKVVPLFRRRWMQTAAAAVVAGGLLVGGLQIFKNKPTQEEAVMTTADTASTLIAEAKPRIQPEIKKVSTEDLQNFVKSIPATADVSSKKEVSKKEVANLLKDVSVNDMEDFLSAVPQPDEDLSVAD